MNRSILASCSYDRRVCVWKEMQPQQWTQVNSVSFSLGFFCFVWVRYKRTRVEGPPNPSSHDATAAVDTGQISVFFSKLV